MKTLSQSLAALSGMLLLIAAPGATAGEGCSSSKAAKQASWHQSTPNIVETAVAAGGFNTLVAALKAADLVETLEGDGPFTVFAPTDAAFAALPKGTLESLLANPEALRSILTYHVVSGALTSEDVADRRRARTVQGTRVLFENGQVNGASIVKADIQASNGIIHVIDAVILPQERVGG